MTQQTTGTDKNGPEILDTEKLVCQDILLRQQLGISKYGRTVAQNPLELRQWMQHAYEEMLDGAIYMKRAMQEVDSLMAKQAISQIDVEKISEKVMSMFNFNNMQK